MNERGRRLAWHGVLLFFLSMLEGTAIQNLMNPRMALTAHVGGAMSGMFLFTLGLAWPSLRLGPTTEAVTFWSGLAGFYLSSAGLLLAAVVGTNKSTPLNGLPAGASPLLESIVSALLSAGAIAVLLMCGLLLWGLRGRRT